MRPSCSGRSIGLLHVVARRSVQTLVVRETREPIAHAALSFERICRIHSYVITSAKRTKFGPQSKFRTFCRCDHVAVNPAYPLEGERSVCNRLACLSHHECLYRAARNYM